MLHFLSRLQSAFKLRKPNSKPFRNNYLRKNEKIEIYTSENPISIFNFSIEHNTPALSPEIFGIAAAFYMLSSWIG